MIGQRGVVCVSDGVNHNLTVEQHLELPQEQG